MAISFTNLVRRSKNLLQLCTSAKIGPFKFCDVSPLGMQLCHHQSKLCLQMQFWTFCSIFFSLPCWLNEIILSRVFGEDLHFAFSKQTTVSSQVQTWGWKAGVFGQIKHGSFFSPTLLDRPVKDPLIVGQIKINDFFCSHKHP